MSCQVLYTSSVCDTLLAHNIVCVNHEQIYYELKNFGRIFFRKILSNFFWLAVLVVQFLCIFIPTLIGQSVCRGKSEKNVYMYMHGTNNLLAFNGHF